MDRLARSEGFSRVPVCCTPKTVECHDLFHISTSETVIVANLTKLGSCKLTILSSVFFSNFRNIERPPAIFIRCPLALLMPSFLFFQYPRSSCAWEIFGEAPLLELFLVEFGACRGKQLDFLFRDVDDLRGHETKIFFHNSLGGS